MTMAKSDPVVSVEYLRRILSLDESTGRLYWKPRPVSMFEDGAYSAERVCQQWNARFAGKEALFAVDRQGYRHGCIFSQGVKAHRAVFALLYGRWPEADIDHINGIPGDNRPSNIREVSRSENSRNQSLRANNKTGFVGVNFDSSLGSYRATLFANGRQIYLGRFSTAEEAHAARQKAGKFYGYHENHGRKSA